jgi:hypothetical protein
MIKAVARFQPGCPGFGPTRMSQTGQRPRLIQMAYLMMFSPTRCYSRALLPLDHKDTESVCEGGEDLQGEGSGGVFIYRMA